MDRQLVFCADKRAFMDRYELAKGASLAGICSWALGEEDAPSWAAIPVRRRG